MSLQFTYDTYQLNRTVHPRKYDSSNTLPHKRTYSSEDENQNDWKKRQTVGCQVNHNRWKSLNEYLVCRKAARSFQSKFHFRNSLSESSSAIRTECWLSFRKLNRKHCIWVFQERHGFGGATFDSRRRFRDDDYYTWCVCIIRTRVVSF